MTSNSATSISTCMSDKRPMDVFNLKVINISWIAQNNRCTEDNMKSYERIFRFAILDLYDHPKTINVNREFTRTWINVLKSKRNIPSNSEGPFVGINKQITKYHNLVHQSETVDFNNDSCTYFCPFINTHPILSMHQACFFRNTAYSCRVVNHMTEKRFRQEKECPCLRGGVHRICTEKSIEWVFRVERDSTHAAYFAIANANNRHHHR